MLLTALLGAAAWFVWPHDVPPLAVPQTPRAENEPTVVPDVRVIAELRGRVVDARGQPVAATVTAFCERGGTHVSIGATDVGWDGAWHLRVLPDEALLVVAQPIGHGTATPLPKAPFAPGNPERQPKDTNLLPASRPATCKAGNVEDVPDLVLADATELHVFALWSDGAPIAGAQVQLLPRDGEALRIEDGSFVHREVDGRVTTTSNTVTDTRGAASLPMVAGARADVELILPFVSPPARFVQAITDTAVEFRISRPVTLRAMTNGKPALYASFAVQGWTDAVHTSGETCQIMVDAPLRVRAMRKDRRSPWIDIGPEAAGRTIDLELAPDGLREVRVTLEGVRAGYVGLQWRTADGTTDSDEMMWKPGWWHALWLPPGRCTVRVTSGLRTETVVDVGDDTTAVTIPVRHGAGIVVHAKDDSGWYFAGTCQIVAANGDDVTSTFTMERDLHKVHGARGEIVVGGPNRMDRVLPAGEYELHFDILGRGPRSERVTLREGEVTNVRVRL